MIIIFVLIVVIKLKRDKFIILDIETNVEDSKDKEQCSPNTPYPSNSEHFHVIQIGALKINSGQIIDTFDKFIKPVNIPEYPNGGKKLTDFIIQLTKIQQSDVDKARLFPEVWNEFLKFCKPYYSYFGSWGFYDWEVLKRNCDYYKLKWPFEYHVNLKDYFSYFYNMPKGRKGLKRACEYFNIPYSENAHNGMVDVKMIYDVMNKMWKNDNFHTFTKHKYDENFVKCSGEYKYFLSPLLVKKYNEVKKEKLKLEKYFDKNGENNVK